MDIFSLSSNFHYSHASPPFSTSTLAGKHHSSTTIILASGPSQQDSSHNLTTHKPLKTSPSNPPNLPQNPLKKFVHNSKSILSADTLSSKLWLSSKLSPPPPPLQETVQSIDFDHGFCEISQENDKEMDFREKGKIFVGNLPLWIKKNEVAEFFRQFGPIKNVILIKGHDDVERNVGFGFVIYDGNTAEKAAMKAVEFDGVEFHGRVLTVKLDNGRRLKGKYSERARWMEGKEEGGEEYRSKWHEEREGSRRELQKILDSEPENWQAVVRAFERIKKVKFGL